MSLDERGVSAAVRAAGIDVPGRFVELTGSTNADVMSLAEQGAPEWTVLVAAEQRAGRGRLGRTWVAPRGSSLLVSVLLRPTIAPPQVAVLSLAAATAMAVACVRTAGVAVRCKWPNDLVYGGRKVGGVLAEATVRSGRLVHVVIGVGVNVSQSDQDFPPDLRAVATSLTLHGGRPESEALLREYLLGLRALYGTGGRGLPSRLWPAYLEHSDTIGRMVRATTTSGAEVVGVATGIADNGQLELSDPITNESTRVAFGDIDHLR
jgi:BirA family biotin operon repressor/biotin-[acetyl-CoA-carboxylase] ligase